VPEPYEPAQSGPVVRPIGAGPIDPEQVLLPGRNDATRLTWLWLVRRACTGLLFVGVLVGILVAGAENDPAYLEVDTSSADSVLKGILTSFGLVFFSIVLRLITGWIGLAFAYPLAREHQGEPETGLLRRASTYVDRYSIVRAFRELRWTEGVRTAALRRLGDGAHLYQRVDRSIGIANVVAGLLCVPAFFLFGLTIRM
jgi:hypothetical protein